MEGRLILDPPAPGSWNMAVDELLLERAAEGAPPCLRFYGWSEPTLSLGYFQSVAERDTHAESRQAALVRRSTGGGAILHHFELTYSWTCAASGRSSDASRELYLAFHETALQLLTDRGVDARLATGTERPADEIEPFLCFQRRAEGDLLAGAHKVLGSAQRRRQGALLQHGSLLIRTSPCAPELSGLEELHGGAFDVLDWIDAWSALVAARLGVRWRRSERSEQEDWRARSWQAEKFQAERWTARR